MGTRHRNPTEEVVLRDVVEDDLPYLFEHQCDEAAAKMAAFTPRGRDAFFSHWAKILTDDSVIKKSILAGDQIVGNVVSFDRDGERLVGYWLGREFWGRGIATRALAAFVTHDRRRPLSAIVAKRNIGSIRVLEKCGFDRTGEGRGPGWNGEDYVDEFNYTLAE